MRKLLELVVALTLLLAVTQGFPGARRESAESLENDDEKSVLNVPVFPVWPPSFRTPGEDDTDFDGFHSAWSDSFRTSIQDMFERMRRRMASLMLLNYLGSSWNQIPEGANTTSKTKVIDGHVVTVNETTYSNNENGNVVIRVRVIDVKPQNKTIEDGTEVESGATEAAEESSKEETTTPARSVETVEDFSNNEIPKSQVDTLNA